MNITLSLDEKLVKSIRKIAVEKDTTLTGLVRAHLEHLAAEHAASGRKRREREALDRSFSQFRFLVGNKTWKREDMAGSARERRSKRQRQTLPGLPSQVPS
jgi:hypothetical protein